MLTKCAETCEDWPSSHIPSATVSLPGQSVNRNADGSVGSRQKRGSFCSSHSFFSVSEVLLAEPVERASSHPSDTPEDKSLGFGAAGLLTAALRFLESTRPLQQLVAKAPARRRTSS